MSAAKKKRKPCPSCGAPFQRGRYVWRLLPDGPARQRVCQTCAGFAVPILASDAPVRCQACGDALAAFCRGCIAKVVQDSKGRSIVPELLKRAKRR